MNNYLTVPIQAGKQHLEKGEHMVVGIPCVEWSKLAYEVVFRLALDESKEIKPKASVS